MTDGIRAVLHTRELLRDLERIDRRVDRATMWAVREAGRTAKREARRAAPVLRKGSSGDRRTVTRKQLATGGRAVNPNAPVAGLLRASIGSTRRLKRFGPAVYGVNVAPRGYRVHFYSGKAEARSGYMRAGRKAAANAFPVIARRAWGRSTRTR